MNKSKIAVDIFNKRASEYQNKFMDVSLYHNSFDLFCDNVQTKNAEVLEIACGPGNITRYLLNKRSDFKILATDLAPNMLTLAKANNPQAKFQLMDGRDIAKINKQFDAIMCGFCFPYFSKKEAIQFINDASKILKSEGILYISTMEDDYSKSGFKTGSAGDEIYLHYHETNYLTQALTTNGFTIIELKHQDFPTQNEKKEVDLIIIARK